MTVVDALYADYGEGAPRGADRRKIASSAKATPI